MMISPDTFIKEHVEDSYSELLQLRDELINEVRAFEQKTLPDQAWMMLPSPQVVYQCNLEYLGILCNYISKRYNQEFVEYSEDDLQPMSIHIITRDS
jgi:hypothetical protein